MFLYSASTNGEALHSSNSPDSLPTCSANFQRDCSNSILKTVVFFFVCLHFSILIVLAVCSWSLKLKKIKHKKLISSCIRKSRLIVGFILIAPNVACKRRCSFWRERYLEFQGLTRGSENCKRERLSGELFPTWIESNRVRLLEICFLESHLKKLLSPTEGPNDR